MDTLNDYDEEDTSVSSSSHDNHRSIPPNQPPPTSQRLNHIRRQQQQQQQQPWIQQLQAQPEFHNPHFFEAVVEHFGIDSLGTHVVPVTRWNTNNAE